MPPYAPPSQPCRHCSSSSFVLVSQVSIEVATEMPGVDRHPGHAFVCCGCGHVDYFVHDVKALTVAAGGQIVTTEIGDPYRRR